MIVRTDALDNIRDADRSNNQLASSGTIAMDVPTLPLGQTITPTLPASGDLYYQFNAQAGQNIDITTDLPVGSNADFLVRYGAPPTLDQFDQEYPYPSDSEQDLSIQDAQQGTYYILVHNLGSDPISLDLLATVLAFEVDGVSPAIGSNVGDATVTITGAEFTPGAVVSLVASDGTTRAASQVWWKDSGTLWATFDLTGLATGVYDVSITDGGQTATDPGAFTVTNGAAGSVQFHLLAPSGIRPEQLGEVEIVYTNPGDTDAPVPILSLTSLPAGSTSAGAQLRLPGQTSFGASSVQFLALNPDGPAGILPPRSSFTYTIDFEPGNSGGTGLIIQWALNEASPSSAIDWTSLEPSLEPSTIPADAWDAIYSNFTAEVGSTWGDLQSALDADATYLSQLGPAPYDLSSLLAFQFQQADDVLPTPILTSATDVSDQEPGLSLDFDRSFLQSIQGRYSFGPLGRGWAVNWFSSLSTDAQGDVDIEDGGATSFFTLQSDGSYVAQPGDYESLTLNQGLYYLQDPEGTVTVYHADGSFDYEADSNGNRITAVYTGSRITSLVDSNGDALTIAYNDQGLISQVTDAFGRVTTYGYDSSGQHLVSVTGPDGTTTYQYSTATSGPTANELLEIGNPDGHEYFTYDASGRLIGQSLDGGAEAVSFAYSGPGGVDVTDATGATTTLLFNAAGQVGEVVDALGNGVKLGYDADNNLTSITEPGGLTYTYSYDASGNLTSATDPLGQTVNMTYQPASNQLLSLTDANGNTTNYAYNSQGDLLSITYPGGTGEQFSYNPLGELTESIDGNGNPISYNYNAQGLVTQETFADGSTISYAYDSHQNLVSATDSSGTTTLEYNSADELTKIAYPTGMFLEFTYNAGGQRIQSVDQTGFTVNYSYDAAGLLSELTDGSGNLIVKYTYNAAGELVRKDMGNGTYTTYTYDADGNVLDLVNDAPDGSMNSFFDYTYDALGRVVTESTIDGQWTYSYDAIGELTHAVFASTNHSVPSQDLTYSYDANGNRIETIDNGVTTGYVTNALNQYTSVGDATLAYDADGNLISENAAGVTTTYTYDELNHLIGASGPDGNQTFSYDALGKISSSTTNGVETEYLIDPTGLGNIVGSYDAKGDLLSHYVYGFGLTSEYGTSGQTAFYDFDATGSTVGLSGPSGTYLDQYSYVPFGQTMTSSGALANPFTFDGQEGSMEGGNGLSSVGGRTFDAETGRFTTPAPLQVLAGESNIYSDQDNNPIDPLGSDGQQLQPNEFTWPDLLRSLGDGLGALGQGVRNEGPEIGTWWNSFLNNIPNPAANPAIDVANEFTTVVTYPLTQLASSFQDLL
ncbi:MAG: RHS repeat-associated core domain-containing protein [Isosphaeraceae bacterium]